MIRIEARCPIGPIRRPARRAGCAGAAPPPHGTRPEPAAGRDLLAAAVEPRHVHAVPTAVDHKIEAADRALQTAPSTRARWRGSRDRWGSPTCRCIRPARWRRSSTSSSAGSCCWYRYEVDLSETTPVVRGAGQGYELTELTELERHVNATADDLGRLSVDR